MTLGQVGGGFVMAGVILMVIGPYIPKVASWLTTVGFLIIGCFLLGFTILFITSIRSWWRKRKKEKK